MFRQVVLYLAVITSVSITLAQPLAAQTGKPNVIVILADDLGYVDLGVQGGKDIPTPNIDSLAKNGVRCTQGYVSCPYCSPTRAGLNTGRYQTRFGHEFNEPIQAERDSFGLPLSEKTMANRFKDLGYATCAIGKWHLGYTLDRRPTARGYDEFFGTLSNTPFYSPTNFVDSKNGTEIQPRTDPIFYTTDAYGERAEQFIVAHKGGPFLLYLPFLVIDMVVASVLMSLGMMMLPPNAVSLPFKLIFFVLVDGWRLVSGSLVLSFAG